MPLASTKQVGAVSCVCFNPEVSCVCCDMAIALKYYGPAHTDCDISVTFAEDDVVHVGDTFWNGIYPFIDYSTGGSIDGMIAASEANLAVTTDKTIIIPGHGKPVSNRAELKAFRDSWSRSVRMSRSSRHRAGHGTKLSPPSRPLPSMPYGATSLSIRASSPALSTRVCDPGDTTERAVFAVMTEVLSPRQV